MDIIVKEYGTAILSLFISILLFSSTIVIGSKIGDNVVNAVQLQNDKGQQEVMKITPKDGELSDFDVYTTLKTWNVISGSDIKYSLYTKNPMINVTFDYSKEYIHIGSDKEITAITLDNEDVAFNEKKSAFIPTKFKSMSEYHKLAISYKYEDDNEEEIQDEVIYYITKNS